MFCKKCGEAIPDGSRICPLCGADMEDDEKQAVIYASQQENEESGNDNTGKQKPIKSMAFVLFGIAIVVAVIVVVFSVQKYNSKIELQKELKKEWYDVDGLILKVLEFRDDEVEYRLETGYSWMDTTMLTADYKVISRNKIKIQTFGKEWITYTIDFNDDKTVMIITPAITSANSSERWYDID